MKTLKFQTIVLVSLISIFFTSTIFSQNRSIQFVEGKWSEILVKAKESNKIIFMDAYTEWCGPCKMLAKNIFTKDEVADFYNDKFICVHFDMEKDEGIGLAKKYKVRGYPSLLFIDSDGKAVHRFVGAPKLAKSFIEIGEIALNPTERLAYYQEQYAAGNIEGIFIKKYLERLSTAYIPKEPVMKKYFATQEETNLISRANWEIIYFNVGNMNSREFKYLLNHQEEFMAKYSEDSVTNKIYSIFLKRCFKMIYDKDFDKDKYEALKSKIRKSNFKLGDQLILTSDLQYYSRNEKWKEYINLAYENVDKYYLEDNLTLNNIAWNFQKNTKKKEYLLKAEEWIIRSVELDSKSSNNDTYAAIMYKLGNKEEAIKQQETALKLAKEEGRSTKSFEARLAKMKK